MQQRTEAIFIGDLVIGQEWCDSQDSQVCRIVTIDPALGLVATEDPAGHMEMDTIRHFLSTHTAAASRG